MVCGTVGYDKNMSDSVFRTVVEVAEKKGCRLKVPGVIKNYLKLLKINVFLFKCFLLNNKGCKAVVSYAPVRRGSNDKRR